MWKVDSEVQIDDVANINEYKKDKAILTRPGILDLRHMVPKLSVLLFQAKATASSNIPQSRTLAPPKCLTLIWSERLTFYENFRWICISL